MPIEPLLSVIIPAYNPGEQVRITVEALVAQQVRKPVEVIVVDDGSEPAIDIDLANLPATIRFNIVRLFQNTGRAGACNAGIRSSRGQYITILDGDCIPEPYYLSHLVEHIEKKIPLFFGHIIFCSTDRYFDNYCNKIQRSRYRDMDNWELRLTSANFTVKRDLIKTVGGFNTNYRHYGFEDRDLFIRLKRAFPDLHPIYLMSCGVRHVDGQCLDNIINKFVTSGCYTASVFREEHPNEYKKMALHHFDAQYHLLYRILPRHILCFFASRAHVLFTQLFKLGRRQEWPLLSNISVKFLSGLAYFRGTLLQSQSE